MPVVAVVFDAEQSVVGGLCVGKDIPGRCTIDKSLFQQESNKPAFWHHQFFGGGAKIGAVVEVDE